jgi:hypothetical protein
MFADLFSKHGISSIYGRTRQSPNGQPPGGKQEAEIPKQGRDWSAYVTAKGSYMICCNLSNDLNAKKAQEI